MEFLLPLDVENKLIYKRKLFKAADSGVFYAESRSCRSGVSVACGPDCRSGALLGSAGVQRFCDISPACSGVVRGGWYPLERHLFSENYIFNPGYVNFLILYLKIFGTFSGIGVVNICLNCVLLWAVYDITARLASSKASYLAVIFFCILPSNILVAAVTMSDLFFAALIYAAISLPPNPWAILVAGLLTGMANYVRPIALLLSFRCFCMLLSESTDLQIWCCFSRYAGRDSACRGGKQPYDRETFVSGSTAVSIL